MRALEMNMNEAIQQFLDAHDRYESLDSVRTDCLRPAERERMHIEIMKAYLEMQLRARLVTGLQYADGMEYAEVN